MNSEFPRGFKWGVATAAPQIEGAASAHGKGQSIWDVFSRKPGTILNNDNLDVACDHYYRYQDDFALMANLGVKNYRFSVAWPRLYPEGRGPLNRKGLDFYHRLIDGVLAEGITPWITMFHWDLPQALEDVGGWRSRDILAAFEIYAETLVKAYGDRVKNWITLNEILCFTKLGYGEGVKAPGARESAAVVNQTYHHALVCHGLGVRAVRTYGGAGSRVGLTDNSFIPVPVTELPRDIEAARQVFITENIRVLDPIYRGRYDSGYIESADAPQVYDDDFRLISLRTDFLGLNIYTGHFVRAGENGQPELMVLPPSYPHADSPWLSLNARALYWGPKLAADVYGVKDICITENGAGYNDGLPLKQEIVDLHRLEYVRNCLRELKRAIDDKVPISAYFLWSFLDNFEWEDGYQRRFGIVHVDFDTQKRTPKISANWYREVMRENRVV